MNECQQDEEKIKKMTQSLYRQIDNSYKTAIAAVIVSVVCTVLIIAFVIFEVK